MREAATAIELRHVTKKFPGVTALDDVSIIVSEGDVHAILGENGAGKSTLIKIISGVYNHGTFDGELYFFGERVSLGSIRDAEKLGIVTIYQELSLFNELSVAENIFAENMPTRFGVIDWEQINRRTRKLLDELELGDVSPATRVGNLGIGQQQLVEIARGLSKNARVMILDEPTSALSDHEVETLFRIIRKLRDSGVTCIYISHRLSEVTQLVDVATVLRDGRFVGQDDVANLTISKMIYMMVGRQMDDLFPKMEFERREKVLEVRDLTLMHPTIPDKRLVDSVSFDAYRGELLGIAGLMGSGRTELATTIFGIASERSTGEILLEGKPVPIHSPNQAIANGIVYLPEDRKRHGLVLPMSVKNNMTLAHMNSSRRSIIDADEEVADTMLYVNKLSIKTPSVVSLVRNLSGGNQQKVVIGKWLMTKPKVMILDEVTRGIDVGAKFEIYKIMNELVSQGVVVIFISSELPELLGLCDRILVMQNGRLSGEIEAAGASQEDVMHLATS
jgi:ABC-type sugar transport system ATPase subunit